METEWKVYPVLHLDLNAKKYTAAADLPAMLNQHLEKWEVLYGDEKKDRSPEERFAFLTGVTKFSQVSVFSDLNQLNDISMKPQYAVICGITRQELLDTFTLELIRLGEANHLSFDETVEKMTALYDGYHFCAFAEGMFNPFSVLNVFDGYKFSNSLMKLPRKP